MGEFDISSIPIIGSLFNWIGTGSANNKNAEQAQLNRDFQERMFVKSMQFTENMWNKANDYNKPINQVQRLKQAGINPAFALGQVSSGVANNVGSPGSPSGAQATFQPKSIDSSQFIRLFEAQNQAKLLNSQVEKTNQEKLGLQMDNNYRNAMNLAELYKKRAEADSAKARAHIDNVISSYQDQFSQAELHAINQSNKNAAQQYELGELQKIESNYRLATLPDILKIQLAQEKAKLNQLIMSGKIQGKQLESIVQDVINKMEDARGKKFNNDLRAEIRNVLVAQEVGKTGGIFGTAANFFNAVTGKYDVPTK